MPEGSELLSMVATTAGIYGTAPTCHLSGLARMPTYTVESLDEAIEGDRSLVRARTMRNSVYTLPRNLLSVALPATRKEALRGYASVRRKLGDDYPVLADRVEHALEERPLPGAEIRSVVDPERRLGSGFNLLLGLLAAECRIVRATTTGGWRSNRLTYARWQDWIPDVDPHGLAAAAARHGLAERYVRAYGPVEFNDVRWWAGWSMTDTRAAVDGLDLSLVGGAHLDGLRLLPVWDALMVAYRHRDRLLDPDHARFVYDRFGNATSVVLDDGRVVGIWDLGRSDDPLTIAVAPFGPWPPRRWEAAEEQAHRIGAMIGAGSVEVARRSGPVDLVDAPRNRFLSPLSNG